MEYGEVYPIVEFSLSLGFEENVYGHFEHLEEMLQK